MSTLSPSLIDRVQRALDRLARPGIEGWGLRVWDGVPHGEIVAVGPAYGCTNERCNHVSHDPADSTYKWIPPQGSTLHELGDEPGDGDLWFSYYVLRMPDGTETYLKQVVPRHEWSTLRVIEPEEVPDWAFARLAQE